MAISQAHIIESLGQACSTLNRDEFIFSFLDAYGFPKNTITRLRNGGDNRNVGEGNDVAIKKKLYFRKVAEGDDLNAEIECLKESEVIAHNDIRFVIVTDFINLVAFDLKAEERLDTSIKELDKQYAFFLPLAGYEKAIMYSEHPADVKASEKMGQLFDLIRERNDLSTPEEIHALNVFLTRLLFCFYAEDTGIFQQGQMTAAIQSTTKEDGSDVAKFFVDLFAVLNLESSSPQRSAMPVHFQAFPYVNGGLFRDHEPIPEFGRKARRILLDCGSLDWSEINPDIFGSMFQAVIDEEQRGNLGQHYTSVSNIMKVIQPLFLDKLYTELEKSRKSEKKLKELLLRLQNLRIFDPACGSGNFLIIAYKELRKLEMEIIDALNAVSGQNEIYYSGIRLSQFFGIEIDDFAHEVAILSLWLAQHQMNMAFKAKFGYAEAALPLRESGNIVCGNALLLDWSDVCPVINNKDPFEVYICGNPPFNGYNSRSEKQREEMEIVFHGFKKFKDLDYVSCWFWIAAKKISRYMGCVESAFVTTNSITQGEQVSLLWPSIFSKGVCISFAYQTFNWKNSAKDNAGVHVAVIGLSSNTNFPRELYIPRGNEWLKRIVSNISPYLTEGKSIAVISRTKPLSNNFKMIRGSQPTDGGHLFLTTDEKDTLCADYPNSKKWIRKIIGADEYIKNKERWFLWLCEASNDELEELPKPIKDRLLKVTEVRLASTNIQTRELAKCPHQLWQDNQPRAGEYIVVPRVTTKRRQYLPIGFLSHDIIATDLVQMIPNGGLFEFGVLSSTMHMDWMRLTCGRMREHYRYSAAMVYNTFPWPTVGIQQRKQVESLAEEVLLIREDYPEKSLADLYDPDKMPSPLCEAHKALDCAVEKLYRDKPFRDASERLDHLFERYEKLIAAEKAKAPAKKTTTRSK